MVGLGCEPRRLFFRLSHSGQMIAVLQWGAADRVVVFHHANGFCGALWAPVARALAPRYSVFALDARGHGRSSKPTEPSAYRWECFADDLSSLCEQILLRAGRDAIDLVVGHSFGGTSAVVAAALRPELFRRLVLVDPVVPPPPTSPELGDGSRVAHLLAAGARRRTSLWQSREGARRSWEANSFFANWDREVFDLYLEEGLRSNSDGTVELRCPPWAEAMIFEAGPLLDLYEFAKRVPLPVLVLHAEHGSFPKTFHQALVGALPQGALQAVAGGHLLPMEAPGLVAEAIMRFCG